MTTTHTVQHDYVTQSGRLVREKVTEDGTLTAVMDFVYDESGRPVATAALSSHGQVMLANRLVAATRSPPLAPPPAAVTSLPACRALFYERYGLYDLLLYPEPTG